MCERMYVWSTCMMDPMFLDLLINVIIVHRAAIWAWCGWVWQGMGSAAVWIYASCYSACSLVEEPGWGMRCHCTINITVGSCKSKWVKIWNVGLQMHLLCTLISENTQLTVFIYWQQCKDVCLCHVMPTWNFCVLKDVAITPQSTQSCRSVPS
jgi:hypothetical protein